LDLLDAKYRVVADGKRVWSPLVSSIGPVGPR
jgi:hypothetical protein